MFAGRTGEPNTIEHDAVIRQTGAMSVPGGTILISPIQQPMVESHIGVREQVVGLLHGPRPRIAEVVPDGRARYEQSAERGCRATRRTLDSCEACAPSASSRFRTCTG